MNPAARPAGILPSLGLQPLVPSLVAAILTVAVASTLLAGCGKKGDLKPPAPTQEPEKRQ
jgi:hypothetical protein